MRGDVSEKLKPFLKEVQEQIEYNGKMGVGLTPALARKNLSKLSHYQSKIPEIKFVEDRTLSVKINGNKKNQIEASEREILTRIYSQEPKKPSPLILFFHGGGHMCGSVEVYDRICRKICLAANCHLISVDYRLAPENPYPSGLNDCKEILLNFEALLEGVNFNGELILAGDSAGGALAATLSSRYQTNEKVLIKKQILIYPSLDYSFSAKSLVENGEGFLLETSKIRWYFDHYFSEDFDRHDVSPLHMKITGNIPKTLIFIAGCDPLRDEAVEYSRKLVDAGVEVKQVVFDDMIHAFLNLEDLVPEEASKVYDQIRRFIDS